MFDVIARLKERLLFWEKLCDDRVDLLFSVGMSVDDLDELAVFVVGDDAVSFEFGFLNFFGTFFGTYEDVLEDDFLTLCLFEVIHDDLNLITHWSSVVVVEGERRDLGFSGFFSGGGFGFLG